MNNQIPANNWKNLIHLSQVNSSKSKVEVLAIIELLSKEGRLNIYELEILFKKCYDITLTQRKLRSILNLMEHNNIISSSLHSRRTYYYISESSHTIATPTPLSQIPLLATLLFLYFFTDNMNIILILVGSIISIVVNQVNYFISTRNGLNYYIKFQRIKSYTTKNKNKRRDF